jgi:hypothetical protein
MTLKIGRKLGKIAAAFAAAGAVAATATGIMSIPAASTNTSTAPTTSTASVELARHHHGWRRPSPIRWGRVENYREGFDGGMVHKEYFRRDVLNRQFMKGACIHPGGAPTQDCTITAYNQPPGPDAGNWLPSFNYGTNAIDSLPPPAWTTFLPGIPVGAPVP